MLQGLVSALGLLGDGEGPDEPADVPVARGGSGSWIETLVEVSERIVGWPCVIIGWIVLTFSFRQMVVLLASPYS